VRQFLKSSMALAPARRLIAQIIAKKGFPIFMFHRVLPDGRSCYDSEMVTPVALFESFLNWAHGRFRVVHIGELIRCASEPTKDKKPLCAITFDDGWRDNYTHALPLLQEYETPATVFLAVGMIGSQRRLWQERLHSCLETLAGDSVQREWVESFNREFSWYPPLSKNDFHFSCLRQMLLNRSSQEAEAFVSRLEKLSLADANDVPRSFLNWEEVSAMRKGGVQFGSHTSNHTLLTRASPEVAWNEIANSRMELENHLREPVSGFAYPWGKAARHVTQFVRDAGYSYAVTTKAGLFSGGEESFLLPRIAISGNVIGDPSGAFSPALAEFSVMRAGVEARRETNVSAGHRSSPERLRIAFVVDRIWDWTNGGTEHQLAHMIEALDRRYFEPELFVLRPTERFEPDALPYRAHLVGHFCASSRAGLFRTLCLFRALKKELAIFRPHIVQTFLVDSNLGGPIAARLAGVPIVVQSRRNLGSTADPVLMRIVRRIANRLTTRWQCNSRAVAMAAQAADGIRPGAIEILPNMIDLGEFKAATPAERVAARQRLGLPLGVPIFISIANLRPVKSHSTLVCAADLLRKKLPDALYLILGEGPVVQEQLTTQINELKLDGCVRLMGAQPDVRPWLAAANIGIITSLSEGSSNSLLEYMAAGLPTVVSEIPANRELAQAVYFAPGNPSDLAEKMYSLWKDVDLQNQIRDRHLEIAKTHGRTELGHRLREFYARLASAMS